ncbi:MAG: hypothetical protein ABJB40_09690 [Acidobacteriota bacterium]
MITKCINWIKESSRLADQYYRAMTAWVTSRRKIGSISVLLRLATAYERALDKALICMRKLRPSKTVEREIADAQHYKALISSDIKVLNELQE